ncbi:hypothetical protein [Mitsuaria sp. GD03876]|uniref:hypothetical protein n=1 Tax=Mitsuaria sp. GD03876 TaxID=2975399 RepID=UPI00244CCDE6|nr:hypothetical protein [Mitsuaria sp. GD03876]MDH0863641.1 hypothetical protein [Mitsuaria sp. GD03876]
MSLIRRLLICCRVLFRTGQAPSGTVDKLDTWLDAQRQRKHRSEPAPRQLVYLVDDHRQQAVDGAVIPEVPEVGMVAL